MTARFFGGALLCLTLVAGFGVPNPAVAESTDAATFLESAEKAFLDAVIAGAFTVPGDGCIDFYAVGKALKGMDYSGWIVVEAEQDPAKAPPKEYSQMGYDHILDVLKASDLEVA